MDTREELRAKLAAGGRVGQTHLVHRQLEKLRLLENISYIIHKPHKCSMNFGPDFLYNPMLIVEMSYFIATEKIGDSVRETTAKMN